MLRMVDIVKQFPGVVANDHVNLDIAAGEIHALLGENGAGKSTLMKILAGSYRPDHGDIEIEGQPVQIRSPRDALRCGIGMIYQHFMLVESMTVLENVLLGREPAKPALSRQQLRQHLTALAQQYDLDLDLDAYIWQLSVGEQQRVEILRLLDRSARIIVLDEPTAVLTPQEAHHLGTALRQIAHQGKAIIIITHKLDEVMEFSDRVTVLHKGRNVATRLTRESSPLELTRLMIGRDIETVRRAASACTDDLIFEVQHLSASGDRNQTVLEDISFTLRRGEILGIAGVAGNGQRELAEVLTGLRPARRGQVVIADQDVTRLAPDRRIRAGLSYVPEDRMRVGSIASLTVSDNLILKAYRQPALSRGLLLAFQSIRAFSQQLIERFNVAAASVDVPVATLSGGNIQKVILAREISAQPKIIIAAHPTRGLDIGATGMVHRQMLEAVQGGAALLLISEDLDELLALSDRIAVMYRGTFAGIVPSEQTSLDALGLMMAGGTAAEAGAKA